MTTLCPQCGQPQSVVNLTQGPAYDSGIRRVYYCDRHPPDTWLHVERVDSAEPFTHTPLFPRGTPTPPPPIPVRKAFDYFLQVDALTLEDPDYTMTAMEAASDAAIRELQDNKARRAKYLARHSHPKSRRKD